MQPGPCVFDFDVIEWMNAIPSTCRAMFGSSDEIGFPDSPAGANAQGDFIRLPFFPWNDTSPSAPGRGSP